MFHKSIAILIACTLLSASAEMAPPIAEDFKFQDKVVPPERINKQIFLPSGTIQIKKADGTIGERLPVFHENIQTFKKEVRGVSAPTTRVLGDNMIKMAGGAQFVPADGRKAVFRSCTVQRDICQISGGATKEKPEADCQETFVDCITTTGVRDLATADDMDAVTKAGVDAGADAPSNAAPAAATSQTNNNAGTDSQQQQQQGGQNQQDQQQQGGQTDVNPPPATNVQQPAAPAPVPPPAAQNTQTGAPANMAPPIDADFKFQDNVVPPERINKTILLPNGKIQIKFANGTIGERFPIISEALQTFKGLAKGVKAPNLRLLGDNKIKIAGNAAFEQSDGRSGVLKSCQIQRDLCEFRGGQSQIDPVCEDVFIQCIEANGLGDIVPADEMQRAIESSGRDVTQQQPAPAQNNVQDQQQQGQNDNAQGQGQNDNQQQTSTSNAPSQCGSPVFVTVTFTPDAAN